jgi:hypothetical protein
MRIDHAMCPHNFFEGDVNATVITDCEITLHCFDIEHRPLILWMRSPEPPFMPVHHLENLEGNVDAHTWRTIAMTPIKSSQHCKSFS